MPTFVKFLASTTGRVVRILAGIAIMALGLLVLNDFIGMLVTVIGAVPMLAGLLDISLLAPLFGGPLSGSKIRSSK